MCVVTSSRLATRPISLSADAAPASTSAVSRKRFSSWPPPTGATPLSGSQPTPAKQGR